MRARNVKQAGWIGLCALVVAGLAQAEPALPKPLAAPPPQAASAADDSGSNFDNLEIVDAVLNSKITVLRVGSALADNNLLSVFVGLKNKTSHRVVLEIETIYKDKAGNELNTGSWIRLSLEPHEESDYRSSAISEAAVDFLVRVRRAPVSAAATH